MSGIELCSCLLFVSVKDIRRVIMTKVDMKEKRWGKECEVESKMDKNTSKNSV